MPGTMISQSSASATTEGGETIPREKIKNKLSVINLFIATDCNFTKTVAQEKIAP
jgi:hypothetical protein